jgi:hypothetical protein
MLSNRTATVFLSLLLLGTGGCLGVEKETVVLTFSPDGNEVRALLVYEGIHVCGDRVENLDNARHELAALTADGQTLYLGSWAFRVSLRDEPTDSEDGKAVKDLLRRHVTVEPGYFFHDPQRRLCYAQPVTVRHVPELLAEINARISARVRSWTTEVRAGREVRPDWMDEQTVGLLHEATGGRGFAWLDLEPGRFSVTIPMTPEAFRRLKQEVVREGDLAALARFLSDVPLSIDQRSDHVTLSVGVGDGRPLIVPFLPDEGARASRYDEDLLRYARSLPVPFRSERSPEEAIAEFLKSPEP